MQVPDGDGVGRCWDMGSLPNTSVMALHFVGLLSCVPCLTGCQGDGPPLALESTDDPFFWVGVPHDGHPKVPSTMNYSGRSLGTSACNALCHHGAMPGFCFHLAGLPIQSFWQIPARVPVEPAGWNVRPPGRPRDAAVEHAQAASEDGHRSAVETGMTDSLISPGCLGKPLGRYRTSCRQNRLVHPLATGF